MSRKTQTSLFPDIPPTKRYADGSSSTFVPNMSLPVHRWFRYSAGFSAEWVESVLHTAGSRDAIQVFDPFAGSATTLIAAELGWKPRTPLREGLRAQWEWAAAYARSPT